MRPITVETLTGRHIEAVRHYAEVHGKKTLLAACQRASARVDVLNKLSAMRRIADEYNKLHARGFFGPWEQAS